MKTTRLAVVSDLQVPFHSELAVDFQVDIVREFRPDRMVVNGDLIDFDGLSRFGTDAGHDLLDELQPAADILARFRDAARRGAGLDYLHGNHERRLTRQTNSSVPKYLRRAVQWDRQRGCEEFARWRQRPYILGRRGILQVGSHVLIHHGVKTGANANELDAFRIASIAGGGYSDQLVILGHTHEPIEPTQCRRTQRIRVPLWHCNAGSSCDPRSMEWTEPNDVSQWEPGVILVEIDSRGWSAEVVTP